MTRLEIKLILLQFQKFMLFCCVLVQFLKKRFRFWFMRLLKYSLALHLSTVHVPRVLFEVKLRLQRCKAATLTSHSVLVYLAFQPLLSSGVIYEIASNVPLASSEGEDHETLALLAASGAKVGLWVCGLMLLKLMH